MFCPCSHVLAAWVGPPVPPPWLALLQCPRSLGTGSLFLDHYYSASSLLNAAGAPRPRHTECFWEGFSALSEGLPSTDTPGPCAHSTLRSGLAPSPPRQQTSWPCPVPPSELPSSVLHKAPLHSRSESQTAPGSSEPRSLRVKSACSELVCVSVASPVRGRVEGCVPPPQLGGPHLRRLAPIPR